MDFPLARWIGYPTFNSSGIVEVTTIYNASIRFGQRVQIQSSIPAASKQWDIISLSHKLESMVPRGAWRTRVSLVPPGVLQIGSK